MQPRKVFVNFCHSSLLCDPHVLLAVLQVWASLARERGRVKDCAFRMGAWASLRVKPDQVGGSRSNVGSSGLDQRQLLVSEEVGQD